jgi:hypothetical protein
MNWKYKDFKEEAVYQAEPGIVREAFLAFAKDWLDDWKLSESADGFEAKGRSAGHEAIAKFRIEPRQGAQKFSLYCWWDAPAHWHSGKNLCSVGPRRIELDWSAALEN